MLSTALAQHAPAGGEYTTPPTGIRVFKLLENRPPDRSTSPLLVSPPDPIVAFPAVSSIELCVFCVNPPMSAPALFLQTR